MLCDKCHQVFNGKLVEIRLQNVVRTHTWAIWQPCGSYDCKKHPGSSYVTWEWLSQRLASRQCTSYTINEEPLKPNIKLLLHHTLNDLESSAERGCPSCRLLAAEPRDSLAGLDAHEKHSLRSIPVIIGPGNLSPATKGPGAKDIPLQLRLWFLKDTDVIQFYWPSSHGPMLHVDLKGPRLPPSTELSGHFQKPTLTKILEWLTDCEQAQQEHARDCPQRNEKYRQLFPGGPKRLLHIATHGADKKVCLREFEDTDFDRRRYSYTTLSHRWGSRGPSKKLLKTQLNQFIIGLPWTDLPKTFQDALEVTAALGFEWIWIDACCIIQDAREDWLRESPRMGPVYANAALNIAATGSVDSSQGLFIQADNTSNKDVEIHWQGSAIDGDWYLLRPGSRSDPDSWRQATLTDPPPLDERAWVIQERLLSPRIIEFDNDQIRWMCHTRTATDLDLDYRTGFRGFQAIDYAIDSGDWSTLVREYMQRDLSFQTDKLVACSGIAQAFAKFHHREETDYLAGLWRQDIRTSLLWHLKHPVETSENLEQYWAPSWSWASVPNVGRKNFQTENHAWDTERRMHEKFYWWGPELWNDSTTTEGPRWQEQFVIVNAAVHSTNGSHFGQLTDAALDVDCLIYPLKMEHWPNKHRSNIVRLTLSAVNFYNNATLIGSYHADALGDKEHLSGAKMYFIPIVLYLAYTDLALPLDDGLDVDNDGKCIDGLVLINTPDSVDTFRRIGMLKIYSMKTIPSWWHPTWREEGKGNASSKGVCTKRIRII